MWCGNEPAKLRGPLGTTLTRMPTPKGESRQQGAPRRTSSGALLLVLLLTTLIPHSQASCRFETQTSGNYTVSSDCKQSQTVEVDGNMLVAGGDGTMRAVDREGGSRHFNVEDGDMLTLTLLHLQNGRGENGGNGDGHGGIIRVWKGGTLLLDQVRLSGGRARYGGGLMVHGPQDHPHFHAPQRVEVRRSTFSGNQAVGVSVFSAASLLCPVPCLCCFISSRRSVLF